MRAIVEVLRVMYVTERLDDTRLDALEAAGKVTEAEAAYIRA